MKKRLKIFLIAISFIVISILITLFIIHQVILYNAHKRAKDTVVGDNIEIIKNLDNQLVITEDDNIGTLTIPAILLEEAPINEGIELYTLSHSIGHFPSTSIYTGNVGFASHNGGGQGAYFKNLHKLKNGSEIYYTSIFGTRKYVVDKILKIKETDFTYLQETEENRITLITCIINKPNMRLCVQGAEI